MKKTNTISLITLLMILAGCGLNQVEDSNLITVDVLQSPSSKKELILQDFMDVEYIPLETNDEFLNQGWVEAVGKKVIVVTNYKNDGDIFVYDRTGKAIRKINRKGQGGEEYTFCTSITLDEENEELFVNDNYAKKIKVYDLEGNFKRSLNQKSEKNSFYLDMFDYDKENLICYDKFNYGIPFLLVSKQDGSTTKEIEIPFKEKKLFHIVLRQPDGVVIASAGPGSYNSIIPFEGNWILFEASSDTIYTLMPDYSLHPFIVRTPPINTMDPEVFVVLKLVSDRYYFMESIKNVYDFSKEEGFPKTYLVYDTQEKDFFRYVVYNGDYSYKNEIYMVALTPINQQGESWSAIDAYKLREDYKKGKLKGKLKEVAATLEEDANKVIMLVKPKK